ncbi:cell division protein FtsX, partial [Acidobacteriota bacterium]
TSAANNLWQYRVRNMFSVMIICLSFLTVGIFLSLSNNLQYSARSVSQNLVIVFFLDNNLSSEKITAIGEEITQSGLFTKSEFINRDLALSHFKGKFPDLEDILENLNTNPFPASYEATLDQAHLDSEDTRDFLDRIRSREGIEDIQFNREWVERMESLSRLVRAIGYFLGSILIFASFLIISNIIKLNVMARKNEIEILKLVGASNTFIRIPFLLEGFFLGMLGGMLSLLFLFLVTKLFPLYLGSSLGVLSELIRFRFLTLPQCLALIGAGSIIGLIGSSSSLAKFLKI